MNITPDPIRTTETQQVEATATIRDADLKPYGYQGKIRWRPESMSIRWERVRVDGGSWSEWTVAGGGIGGPKIKKDGSVGAGRVVERIWGFGSIRSADSDIRTGVSDEIDEWLNGTRPIGDPAEAWTDS